MKQPTKELEGDPHNFNQRVALLKVDDADWVHKPRTIFWENLFLSPQSDLRKLLRNLTQNGKLEFEPDQTFGAIRYVPGDDFLTGRASFFESVYPSHFGTTDAVQLGKLIGTALAFGITDLHNKNVLIAANHFQMVDIECVFWDSVLGSESLLTFGRNTAPSLTMIPKFMGINDKFVKSEIVFALLDGLDKATEFFVAHSEKLTDYFESQQSVIQRHPIRIILRPTKEYAEALRSGDLEISNVVPEEMEQLRRGDVPYFFGFLGKKEIFYYKNPGQYIQVGPVWPAVHEKIGRAFKDPVTLLRPERLLQVCKQSSLEIAHRLLPPGTLVYRDHGKSIERRNEWTKLTTGKFVVQTQSGI